VGFCLFAALRLLAAQLSAQIVLVQHKEHERRGKARTSMRRTMPILNELAYYFAVVTRNGNMF
jgi:hypothetical protein